MRKRIGLFALVMTVVLAVGQARAGIGVSLFLGPPHPPRPHGHFHFHPHGHFHFHARPPLPPPYPRPVVYRPVRYLYAPPAGYVVVVANGGTYYRCGHSYYQRVYHDGAWVYAEVEAPEPVAVSPEPPPAAYEPADSGLPPQPVPVRPVASTTPVASSGQRPATGTVYGTLPAGAVSVDVRGRTYFVARGVYYLPISYEGATKYVVVETPR